MSVPFKYRQYFRDLYSSFGGKPLTADDVRFIALRLPPPSFSLTIVDTYASQCPLDEAGLLKFIAEGQKESGTSYDDIAWGLVEGMSRHNFFGGEEGGDASCDTKELRAVLDSKIRPVRLDVNAIFNAHTAGGERTTIAELMLVFRAIFPANQTNFAELFGWARASRPASRRPRPSEAAATVDAAHHATESAASPPSRDALGVSSSSEGGHAASAPPLGSHNSPVPLEATSTPQVHVADPSALVAEVSSGFSNRERFGSMIKTKPPQVFDAAQSPRPTEPSIGRSALRSASRHEEEPSMGMESSFGSPAPPPPPPDTGSPTDEDALSDASSSRGEPNDATNPFAAIANQSSPSPAPHRRPSPPQPTVTVTPPAALRATTTPVAPQPEQHHPQQQQPHQQQQQQQQQEIQPQPQAVFAPLREPPPLPAHVRTAVQTFSNQQQQQQQDARQGGPSGVEALSLRQVQQLPPEVVDFIQQLDRQRSQLQTQLERELNDLTENQQLIRLFNDRLATLQSLQETPAFKPLEKERADLIHKMEQWVHCTRAGKEAARTELAGLRRAQAADAAAHSVYRSEVLYNRDAPSTTVTSQPTGTAAATAALAALHDPTPRLARFFENLSNKEQEIKAQEAAVEKLRQIERRERRLLAEINAASVNRSGDGLGGSPALLQQQQQHIQHTTQQQLPHHALRQQQPQGGRVFRMDPTILSGGSKAAQLALGYPTPSTTGGAAYNGVQQDLYFNFSQQHRSPPPAATLLGVSRDNPYLSKNIADRQRTSTESGNNVTRRLEDYLSAANHRK